MSIHSIARFLMFLTVALGLMQCRQQPKYLITIVDIGNLTRPELGRQLDLIRKFNPKIIGLDFHLGPDSLWKDSTIVHALAKVHNSVQVVTLHNYIDTFNAWDSLEQSNQKFKVDDHGFANLIDEDSVFIPELPMRQLYRDQPVYAFSYVIAKNSFGVKPRFSDSLDYYLRFRTDSLGFNYNLITEKEYRAGDYSEDDFSNKIVLMGYMGEDEDFHYVDVDKKRKVKGVEIHAALIGQMIIK